MAYAESPGVANAAPFLYGTLAARPAAGNLNTYYWATDVFILFRDNGIAWETIDLEINEDVVWALTAVGDAASTALLNFTVDRVYLAPIRVKHTMTIDGIGVSIGVFNAADRYYAGIYPDDGVKNNHKPDGQALIVSSPSISPVGFVNGIINFFEIPSTQLTSGLYWAAYELNTARTYYNMGAGRSNFMNLIIGGVGTRCMDTRGYDLGAYGALADPCPATSERSGGVCAFHVASVP